MDNDHIRAQMERLIQFPESGRTGRVEGTRELVIDPTPTIAAYRIDGDVIASCVCCMVPRYGQRKCQKTVN